MKAIAPLLALAILLIAPSIALADPYRLHHDYYKRITPALTDLVRHDHGYSKQLVEAGSAGTAASNSVPWAGIGLAFAIAALVVLLLTTLHLTRRANRTRRAHRTAQ